MKKKNPIVTKIEDVSTHSGRNEKARVHVIKPSSFPKFFFFFWKVSSPLPAESDEKSWSNRQMLNHINLSLITSLLLSVSLKLFIQHCNFGNIDEDDCGAVFKPFKNTTLYLVH